MVDDVKHNQETAESKAAADAVDRARLARERREAEQRKKLDELLAHAAAAQAQREKRDEERRQRQAEQRARDDDRRLQVEERKRAIWEASVSRREALLQRERERTERLERARAARSSPRSPYAFGSSTPRLLEPVDSAGFFYGARSTNPLDQMNFFESLAASTTNVMFASAPLTRQASALQLNSDNDNKDEPTQQPQPVMWSSVARRRTDLVPTLPAPRAPGRAYSMTRLDKIPSQRPLHSASPSMHHLNRTQTRSGETTPGSRPGSAMSSTAGVVRRATSFPKKMRPASIAGTGVNTPRGAGGDVMSQSLATTPSVSRDGTMTAGGDAPRRPHTARQPRPHSMYNPNAKSALNTTPLNPADGKPPLHRKPKPSKDHDKPPRGKSLSASPGRTLSPSPAASKEPSVDKEVAKPIVTSVTDKNQVSAIEVTQKLEALQIQNGDEHAKPQNQNVDNTVSNPAEETAPKVAEAINLEKPEEKAPEPKKLEKVAEKKEPSVEKKESLVEKKETAQDKKEIPQDKKETAQEKTDDSEMTASMTARRITTEEEAKAALAERRRRAREDLERQAELERQRLQREAEEEAERQRQEEERQRREEEEARELAQLQRRMEEEKLRKAIEAQQQFEREEAERKAREEDERQARLKVEEEKRRAAEEAERLRKEEAEKEEKERIARKQRVEAIMARTRLKKQAEEQKQQENKSAPTSQAAPSPAPQSAPPPDEPAGPDNGNAVAVGQLLDFAASQSKESTGPQEMAIPQANSTAPTPAKEQAPNPAPNNGNVPADLLGLSDQNNIEDKTQEQTTAATNIGIDNSPNANVPATSVETNNGNVQPPTNVGHISANFIQTERMSAEHSQSKITENVPKLIEDDFTSHNGHGTAHPLTLQNAI